jgi:hypothetical protein
MLPTFDRWLYGEYESDGEVVWVLTYQWDKHPFALVDAKGVGHDDARCGRIDIHIALEATPVLPWPCKSCVSLPAPAAPSGLYRVGVGPGCPAPGNEAQGGAQAPRDRLAAVFGL